MHRRWFFFVASLSLLLVLVCACIALAIHRSRHQPQFWLTGSEPSPFQPGDRGEARVFRGRFLANDQFGWAEFRLTRASEFGWPFRRGDSAPTQDVLLDFSISSLAKPNNHSIALVPLAYTTGVAGFLLGTFPIGAACLSWRRRQTRGGRGFALDPTTER